MLDIKLERIIVCDNGKKYTLCEASYPYKYRLYNDNWLKANELKEHYLEDAIKYNQPICVGTKDDKNLEYTRIIDVEKSSWELREDSIQENLQYLKDSEKRHDEMMKVLKEDAIKWEVKIDMILEKSRRRQIDKSGGV